MFENLSDRLSGVFDRLTKTGCAVLKKMSARLCAKFGSRFWKQMCRCL